MSNSYPYNYDYYPSNDDNHIIRTKFKSEEEINKWVNELSELSKITWSITRTVRTPVDKARKHVFRREYHCHLKTIVRKLNQPRKRPHPSKNIECPAKMIISICHVPKRRSRAKCPDNLASEWPCVIKFILTHNHTTDSAAALIKRPIGEDTKMEVIKYFERGHSAASAYHSFCFKKMEEFGEQYDSLSADRYYCPKKSDFENLWRRHFKTTYGERAGENMFATGSKPQKELFLPLQLSNVKKENIPTRQSENMTHTNREGDNPEIASPNPEENELNTEEIISTAQENWSKFIKKFDHDVMEGLKDNPLGFSSAINSCTTSYNKKITSSSNLMSGLFQMFKFQQCSTQKQLRKTQRKGRKISVQPTSIARRKTLASGKRRCQAGRKVQSLAKKEAKPRIH